MMNSTTVMTTEVTALALPCSTFRRVAIEIWSELVDVVTTIHGNDADLHSATGDDSDLHYAIVTLSDAIASSERLTTLSRLMSPWLFRNTTRLVY